MWYCRCAAGPRALTAVICTAWLASSAALVLASEPDSAIDGKPRSFAAGERTSERDARAAVAALRRLGAKIRELGPRRAVEKGAARARAIDPRKPCEVDFHLRGRRLTNEGLVNLAAIPNIVALNLARTKITGAGLVHLKPLRRLRRLHLERTKLTDDGTEHLAVFTELEYLNLYGTGISDRTLARLGKLKKLRRLYVWQTKVTDAGVVKLEKSLPRLKVVRGVDLSELPEYSEEALSRPKPTEDLKWIAVTVAADVPRSQTGLNTQVYFVNESGIPVKLYWKSYGGPLQLYAELDPGEERQQNSYSKNTWVITDANDKPLGYFLVTEAVSRAVIPKLEK